MRLLRKVLHGQDRKYIDFFKNIFHKKNQVLFHKLISFYQKLQYHKTKALLCIGKILLTVA